MRKMGMVHLEVLAGELVFADQKFAEEIEG